MTFVDLSEFNNSVSSKEDSFTGSSQTSAPRTNGGVPPPLPQRPQSRTTGSLPQVKPTIGKSRPISRIKPWMYVRLSIMYEKAAFY